MEFRGSSMTIYDYVEFRHFVAVKTIADEGSLSRAAEKLNITQPALSQQISDLESLYGVQLFDRGRHGAALTPEGQSFYNSGEQALELREEAVNSMQAVRQTTSRPFRLGFSQFVEHAVLHTVTLAYQEMFPTGEVQPEGDDTDQLLKRVKSGDLNAALVTLPLSFDGLSAQPIMHEKMVVMLCKDDPLAEKAELSPADLTGRLAIFSDPRHHLSAHTKLLAMLQEHGIEPKLLNPTFNFEHIQWLVRQHQCFALIREHEVIGPSLTTRPIEGVAWTIDSAIVYRDSEKHGVLSLLLKDLLRRFPTATSKAKKKAPQRAAESTLPFEPSETKSKKA